MLEALIAHYAAHPRHNGWWAALCPCGHAHDQPGAHFAFQPDLGLGVCLGRHGRLLLRDLCPLLSIRPADYGGYYQKSPHARRHPHPHHPARHNR